ncbi:MAG TPA: hypothetical protein VFM86_15370 [Pedococcus sp.]|nr:hypothetical protein [Pedococcus sp.]
MTEFKKGDRVKVEWKGVVKDVGTYLLGVEIDGSYRAVEKADVTLLERPVEPLAPGSVVRSDLGGVWIVQRGGGVQYVGYSGAHQSSETPTSLARRLRDQPNEFTLIYDGSKK